MQPVIKWTGSKRKQAESIISYMPDKIDTYYEPFIGGGSVLFSLLESCELNLKHVKTFICSDINKDLINIYKIIKSNPNQLLTTYKKYYDQLSVYTTEKNRAEFYVNIRNKYNEMPETSERACVFYWLLRTCYNGLIRYNKSGKFNTSFHNNRLGIQPEKLMPVILNAHRMLNKYDVIFLCEDYKKVLANSSENDFIYMDPPYQNTTGMYFAGGFNNKEYFNFLKTLKAPYCFSYDGKSGKSDNTVYDIPNDIYTEHVYINSGYSSFKKLKNEHAFVKESLYINK